MRIQKILNNYSKPRGFTHTCISGGEEEKINAVSLQRCLPPQDRRYFELRREFLGAVLSTKNHQGGVNDNTDEADAKMFEVRGSPRCPVQTMQNFLSHLNPGLDCLFQRPRDVSPSFKPEGESVWYCNSPAGEKTLSNMIKKISTAPGIVPHLTNHCVRATSVTVLSDCNVEARHIKAVTGNKSNMSIESYSARASFEQKEKMSGTLNSFVHGNCQPLQQISNQTQPALPPQESTGVIVPASASQISRQISDQQINIQNTSTSYTNQPFPNTFHNCTVTIVNNSYSR